MKLRFLPFRCIKISMQKNKKIFMIVGGISVLLVIIGLAFYFGRQTSTQAEPTLVSPRATPEPTLEESTPTPTDTPTPTSKPTPTATVKPTSAPTSTPTPTPTPAPSVVNIETSVSPSGTTHSCNDQTFTFTAKIYTNAATTVKYTWLRSDNASSAEQSITFTGAGMQQVTTTWLLGANGNGTRTGWQRIKVTSPNDALSNQAEFTLICP